MAMQPRLVAHVYERGEKSSLKLRRYGTLAAMFFSIMYSLVLNQAIGLTTLLSAFLAQKRRFPECTRIWVVKWLDWENLFPRSWQP